MHIVSAKTFCHLFKKSTVHRVYILEKIIDSLLIVSNADNCSTLYSSIYCCKKMMQHFYYIQYNNKLFYVFILIDNMFSKKQFYNLISANDNISTF